MAYSPYRICCPGESAIRVSNETDALKNARALSMKVPNVNYKMPEDQQRMAYVWHDEDVADVVRPKLIATFRNGKQVKA